MYSGSARGALAEPWRYGASLPYSRRFVQRWQDNFDWRQWEQRIDRYEQRMISVGGQDIHALVQPGSGPDPLPLVLTHGWPGSFVELIDMIEPLAHPGPPKRIDGKVEGALTLVLLSLPGYGLSPAPAAPVGLREIARLWSHIASRESDLFQKFVIGQPVLSVEGRDAFFQKRTGRLLVLPGFAAREGILQLHLQTMVHGIGRYKGLAGYRALSNAHSIFVQALPA